MRLVVLGLLAALLMAPGPGTKPHLTGLEVLMEGGALFVDFELRGAFDESLIERIQTGLPTGFDFRIKLVKNQPWWFDRSVRAAKFHVVAMYNAVTGEYLVNYKQNGELIESRVVRDIPELRSAMTRFQGLRVFDLSDLDVKRNLWVQARANLGSRNLLLLIPVTIQTDWAESRKFRLPERQQ